MFLANMMIRNCAPNDTNTHSTQCGSHLFGFFLELSIEDRLPSVDTLSLEKTTTCTIDWWCLYFDVDGWNFCAKAKIARTHYYFIKREDEKKTTTARVDKMRCVCVRVLMWLLHVCIITILCRMQNRRHYYYLLVLSSLVVCGFDNFCCHRFLSFIHSFASNGWQRWL